MVLHVHGEKRKAADILRNEVVSPGVVEVHYRTVGSDAPAAFRFRRSENALVPISEAYNGGPFQPITRQQTLTQFSLSLCE